MAQVNIQRDAMVMATDGEVGQVKNVIVDPQTKEVTDLVVEQNGKKQQIPVSIVKSVDGDRVTLSGTRSQLQSASPFNLDHYHPVDGDQVAEESKQQAVHGGAPLLDAGKNAVEIGGGQKQTVRTEQTSVGETPAKPAATTSQDSWQLQLKEEQLRVRKEQEQAGKISVGKRVTEHIETVNVPVREERVIIERTAGTSKVAGRELNASETIDVPVMRERVTASKETMVAEEIDIRREATEHTQQVQETVRKEELVMDEKPEGIAQVVDSGKTTPAKAQEMPKRKS